MLTRQQKKVLDYVRKYKVRKGYSPSLEEIRKHLKLASVSTAHYHIKNLQQANYLEKEQNRPRAISTLLDTGSMQIPLLGSIAAGSPIEAIEFSNENITISREGINLSHKLYALRVEGESMVDEGIFDGDIVVIREQSYADNGQTVVAIIDEGKATLKKFFREKNRIRLQPANQNLLPLYRTEVEVRGVVEKIIRNLKGPEVVEQRKSSAKKVSRKEAASLGSVTPNNIYKMDCVKFMNKIKSDTIDLIFADPPYNLSKSNFQIKFTKSGGKDLSTNKGSWDRYSDSEFEEFTREWIKEAFRILKPGGTIWIAGTYHNIYLAGYLAKKAGFEILGEILWHKSDATPNLSCTRFVADHENFIWARKGRGNTFNYEIMRDLNGGKQMRSVWTRGKTAGGKRIHPTQKPEWLMERIITATSKPGDLVLDPFLGSGTTAVAAKRLGRAYLGSELDAEYFSKAQERIKKTVCTI